MGNDEIRFSSKLPYWDLPTESTFRMVFYSDSDVASFKITRMCTPKFGSSFGIGFMSSCMKLILKKAEDWKFVEIGQLSGKPYLVFEAYMRYLDLVKLLEDAEENSFRIGMNSKQEE